MTVNSGKVRVGVVGVGYFGRFHALKFARLADADLVGVVSEDAARVVEVAAECGTRAYTDISGLLGAVDAVSIATPAHTHGAIARTFLEAGVHVLVEKPLAATLAEADALIALAKDTGLVLQVGHQERAVLAAAGLLDIPETPRAIHCVRKGPFSGRNIDVDVILDLMTHDLDMAHALNEAAIAGVMAKGRALKSPHLDEVEADLTLTDGAHVTLRGSRVHETRERKMTLTYPSGTIAIDFLAHTAENTTPFVLNEIFPNGNGVPGAMDDPLGYALGQFLAAVKGKGPPLVSGEEARFALEAAEKIRAAIP